MAENQTTPTRAEALKAAVQAKIAADEAFVAMSNARRALSMAETQARKGRLAKSFPLTVDLDDGKFCTVIVTQEDGGRVGKFEYIFANGVGE